jgi:hypothetical protein
MADVTEVIEPVNVERYIDLVENMWSKLFY